jgi:glycosyltransferase involved in cell wall biosynthesis
MKLSVILPIYNGEKTLKNTLQSLVNQTFKEFELVVCIDGSKDTSLEIVKSFSVNFSKLKILINEENLGLGPTMNKLVANATGQLIAVAEQDDFYYEYRLEEQVSIFDKMPQIGMVSGIADFYNGEKINFRFPGILVSEKQYPKGKEMFLLNYKNQVKVANSCMMFRKEVHVNKGLYFSKHYPNVGIDWSYLLRFSLVSEIYGIPKSLVLLDRRNDRNSITANKEKMFKASRELIRSFYYEYPNIIKKEDYKFAMTTQYQMELSHKNKYKFILYFILYFSQNPKDKRWFSYLKTKVFKK